MMLKVCAVATQCCHRTALGVSWGNPSATAEHATPKAVRWQHCVATSHTFNILAPPAQLLSRRCATRTSGSPSAKPRSRQPSTPWYKQLARTLDSHCKMLACALSKRGRKWHSPLPASTRTRSDSSRGGGATQCSATFTLHLKVSWTTSLSECSNMATTRSSHQRMPPAISTRCCQIPARPMRRVFRGPGTGLLWTWRFKNSLFTPTPIPLISLWKYVDSHMRY